MQGGVQLLEEAYSTACMNHFGSSSVDFTLVAESSVALPHTI